MLALEVDKLLDLWVLLSSLFCLFLCWQQGFFYMKIKGMEVIITSH